MTNPAKHIDRHGRTIYTDLRPAICDRIFAEHHRDTDVVMVDGCYAARTGAAEARIDATIRRAAVSL